ncbi:MAG TPA: metallophosphoesterase [Chloroflexia bacterium]|nr:metallophosphoesterase [Chloroflexia bacterium]
MRARRLAALLLVGLLAACEAAPTPVTDPAVLPPAAVQPWPTPLPSAAPPAADTVPPAEGAAPAAPGAVDTTPAWTFAVVGDTWKDTPMLRHVLTETAQAGDRLLLVLGDITPQGRPEQMAEFAATTRGAGLPVYPVPGNHDIAWSHTTGPFEQFWPRHQSFDVQNAHFTLVDNSDVTFDAAELAWLDADLAASSQPVKFVFMHVPALMPYPVPTEDVLAAGGPEFTALMERYHVTAAYAAHLHAYSRVTRNGVPYVITGGGGEPLHVPALLGGRFHYVRVTVRGTTAQDTVVWMDQVPTPGP